MPRLREIENVLSRAKKASFRGAAGYDIFDIRRRLIQERRILEKVLIAAARKLAKDSPAAWFERIASLGEVRERAILRVVAYSLVAVPTEHAGDAIRWLIADYRRFRSGTVRQGSSRRGGLYRPACRIIRQHAARCPDSVIGDLERAVLSHKPNDELLSFKFAHSYVMGGFLYTRSLFLGQYLLLSKISRKLLAESTQDFFGVLSRKFGKPNSYLHEPLKKTGGFVGSTIPADKLHLVSDEQWLKLVHFDWSSKTRSWKDMGGQVVGDMSADTIARDLGTMARREPRRFALLAAQFRLNVRPHFIEAVLRALAESKDIPKSPEPLNWQPAHADVIELLFDRFQNQLQDREVAGSLCWLLQKRNEERWNPHTLQRLSRLAIEHPDPGVYENGTATTRDIQTAAINCIRGRAAGAIEAILYPQLERLATLRPAIDSIISDDHPAVRVAAIGVSVPLLNGDRKDATAVFLKACSHPDDEVLTTHHINHFLGYALLEAWPSLMSLIDRMVGSQISDVARSGAQWTAEYWVHSGNSKSNVEQLLAGNSDHREGVARCLTLNIPAGRGNSEANSFMIQLFNDPEKKVRDAAATVFRSGGLFAYPEFAPMLVERFVVSPAVDENLDDVLTGLSQNVGSMLPYANSLLAIVDRFTGTLAADARDMRTRRPVDAGEVAKLLLRLYEQSDDDRSLRRRCLDAWDKLLAERVGYDILKHIDS